MKKLLLPAVALAAMVACNQASTKNTSDSTGNGNTAVENQAVTANPPVDSAMMMQACTNYMQTGPMHQMLAKDNGTWAEEITIWTAPGAPPSKIQATTSVSMLLGGRYQQARYSGSMDGMPFEGISTTGYDNARKKFINTWVDNTSTGMMYLEGDYDSTAKTLRFAGKQTDPVTGKQIDIKQNVTYNDDGSQTMTMYAPPMGGGTEYKTMEVVMKRK